MNNVAHNEDRASYAATVARHQADVTLENEIIERAIAIVAARMRQPYETLSSPTAVKQWLILNTANLDREEFRVLFLDVKNRLISAETMFVGTLTQTSVYPREVMKRALHHNAAGVILSHNHPSGDTTPSRADDALTQHLKEALSFVDVKVLDHIIVAGTETFSYAENGKI